MGRSKAKGKQDSDAEEGRDSLPPSLADFMPLGSVCAELPAAHSSPALTVAQQSEAAVAQQSEPAARRQPPEDTLEELETRHKKEIRELEGAARAAKKAAGKSKAKEAVAAAEQAMERLRNVHESEVRFLQEQGAIFASQRLDDSASAANVCNAEAGVSERTDMALIKGLLAPRGERPNAAEELRIDPADGQAYPLRSFIEVYGDAEGHSRWAMALTWNESSAGLSRGPPYTVMGSKKGGFPVTVESRARGKTVTVIHNVTGDVEALLGDLKKAVGGGGVVRDGDVEVQGDHAAKVEGLLLKLGCIKGVSHTNIAGALLPGTKPAAKATKSIARLDKKASQPQRVR